MNSIKDIIELLNTNNKIKLFDILSNLGKRIELNNTEKSILKKEIEKFLNSESEILREVSLRVLGFYWALPEYKDIAIKIFNKDSDDDVRATALMSWSNLQRNTNNLSSISFLKKLVEDKSLSPFIRLEAYSNIFVISNLHPSSWPKTNIDFKHIDEEIDWKLIDEILKEAEK
ncbi:hypothetical protein KJK34_03225 [Flavobacterium sp. D11R37]|uniref:hypothetical protein n=1 Tax=Flavobacterium coralii TaxID=2838017 RepID=UPI001CA7474F|nr:hypothetical protein [Flavobacterium coralii]MBY8961758.1 hypothetical protein [Flavobacterium coralii]